MHERRADDWTVIETQDLHDQTFQVAHFHPNTHLSLSIPLNRLGHHTRQLSRSQCRKLALYLLHFDRTGQLTQPQGPNNFQI